MTLTWLEEGVGSLLAQLVLLEVPHAALMGLCVFEVDTLRPRHTDGLKVELQLPGQQRELVCFQGLQLDHRHGHRAGGSMLLKQTAECRTLPDIGASSMHDRALHLHVHSCAALCEGI